MYPPSSVTEGSYTCLSGDALSCQQSSSLGHYIDAQQCGASADNSSISFLNVGCYMFHNSRPLWFLLEGSLSATQVSGLPRTRSRRYLHPLCASLYLHDRSRFSHVCQPLTTHAICIAADSTGEIQFFASYDPDHSRNWKEVPLVWGASKCIVDYALTWLPFAVHTAYQSRAQTTLRRFGSRGWSHT